ncbi:MAG: glycosyltransferase family 2 protein [Candidatus Abyssobacteria bacterium SURF_5]|uniref:Glycosyltransferase family 2 protein n=1 Tax=Abyssobacteria bacterium (strain SURF_5) TaxID=2093360 RepID=A0A3A4NIL2_ABYX5|nr:MAG: glycosyltransferase family 2 protein [Candidatus Abyssubacteria bacterium SURF_5]
MGENPDRPSISIVMPAYNERENIEKAVLSSLAVLRSACDDYEVVVVDDGSLDGTAELLDKMAQEHAALRVIHHDKNYRFGRTLRDGIAAARKNLIFLTDSDNPIDMEDMKKAIPLMEEYDFVNGRRLAREPSLKRILYTAVYNKMIRMLFGLDTQDVNFSYKMVKRELLQKLDLKSEGSFIDAEMLLEAKRLGGRIREIPIMYYPRTLGESTLASPSVIARILYEMSRYMLRRLFNSHDSRRS